MVSVIPRLLTKLRQIPYNTIYLPFPHIPRPPPTMACCPPGAWGELKPDADYKNKGAVEKLDGGLEVYVTGKAESDKCVIWNYDIFGFNGGRTRQLCDILGEQGWKSLHFELRS